MDLRVTYCDDSAYIYLRDIEPGGAAHQEVVGGAAGGEVILDFDRDGHLIGIEVLDAKRLLPGSLLAGAEQLAGSDHD